MGEPRVRFENNHLIFEANGLTADEMLAINAYIKMVYREALRTGPVAGAINLASLELADAEIELKRRVPASSQEP